MVLMALSSLPGASFSLVLRLTSLSEAGRFARDNAPSTSGSVASNLLQASALALANLLVCVSLCGVSCAAVCAGGWLPGLLSLSLGHVGFLPATPARRGGEGLDGFLVLGRSPLLLLHPLDSLEFLQLLLTRQASLCLCRELQGLVLFNVPVAQLALPHLLVQLWRLQQNPCHG